MTAPTCTLFRRRHAAITAAVALIGAGCGGAASALRPAGSPAEEIAQLFWWMAGIGAVISVAVVALAVYVARVRPDGDRERAAKRLILAGAGLPTIVLAALLTYSLALLPRTIAPAPAGALRVAVHGEQWWWRIRYEPAGRPSFEVANEIRLPVGRPVEFVLESKDVIHSFWVPALGGKMDLIPGRTNRLVLHPARTGTYDGMCAEFCGLAHAKMRLRVLVVPVEAFERWLAARAPAALPRS